MYQYLELAKDMVKKSGLPRFYTFWKKGRKNLTQFTRDDFAVMNVYGGLFVYITMDKKTKNHRDDSERSSDGRMYDIKGIHLLSSNFRQLSYNFLLQLFHILLIHVIIKTVYLILKSKTN